MEGEMNHDMKKSCCMYFVSPPESWNMILLIQIIYLSHRGAFVPGLRPPMAGSGRAAPHRLPCCGMQGASDVASFDLASQPP